MRRKEHTLSKQDVMKRLRTAIDKAGNQRQFALQIGVTPGYITDVLYGRRALSDRILNAIGVERVTRFVVTYKEKEDAE